ncbi:MAG: VWA domain-containing protein [Gammaproteobacteria bacterium]|nr:VWA domain-containing protein [Gammaproteobacteria bacterium]
MTLVSLQWVYPMVLFLLPLIVLPWLSRQQEKTVVWSNFVPVDPLSNVIGFILKSLASLVIACLILALAQPYIPEQKIERVGAGSEVVLLVDRSRSMDDAFAIKGQLLMASVGKSDSKRRVAKKYLLEFINKRPDDRFGFVLFSDKAVDLLPLTYNKEAVRATINANALGKGLSETNITKALITAANMYDGQAYRGSRIVLLVSDGGREISEEAKRKIAGLYQRENISLYWLYMRSVTGMTLDEATGDNRRWTETPERKLHTFFKSIGVPYKAFEIESVKTFSEAMDAIDKQQYQTLIIEETLPREMKVKPLYITAIIAMLLLVLAQIYTVWGVKKAGE